MGWIGPVRSRHDRVLTVYTSPLPVIERPHST
jgi:hypothetical protein